VLPLFTWPEPIRGGKNGLRARSCKQWMHFVHSAPQTTYINLGQYHCLAL
jgi:hypothetical protein